MTKKQENPGNPGNKIVFIGYNDGKAIAIKNRRSFRKVSACSLSLVIPISVIGVICRQYFLAIVVWAFPVFFLVLSALTFLFVRYDDGTFLQGKKTKHEFTVENGKILKDGKEIRRTDRIRLYRYRRFLLMETDRSFFRIPDDEYAQGSREELLQSLTVRADHSVWLRLPEKTDEEKIDLLFGERDFSDKCRVFYSKDKTRVVYIFRRRDGLYSVGTERLNLADEEESELFHEYGWWVPEGSGISLYETMDEAYRDIGNLISGFEELKTEQKA